MNITFIVKEFPKTSETFIISQVRGLLNLGHDVKVISLRKHRKTFTHLNRELFDRIMYLGYEGNTLRRFIKTACVVISHGVYTDFLHHALKNRTLLSILSYPAIRSHFIDKADIILVHYGDLACNFSFLNNIPGFKKPVVVVFHGVDVARYLPSLSPLERARLWDTMTLGLPVSHFWLERLQSLGCPVEKLRVHHMGVDIERFSLKRKFPLKNILRLVSVCRLVEKKGIDIAIQSIPKVLKAHPGVEIIYDIVGDGPERHKIENLAAFYNIQKRVVFHGEKSHQEVKKILEAANVFVLPSRTSGNGDMEGIPVSLMEAMSCGLAVVSTFHSGIPELVKNGISGLLVDENDIDGIASALMRLISEPDLVIRLGNNARKEVVKNFNYTHLNVELESILKDIIVHYK
ncbi:MAG TPA: colanic acid biosynthesis glycosyltransferase WcaL [bacterium]|nr:colanic acid biosynthesis glycosyltransferase WcaL [bacterium]